MSIARCVADVSRSHVVLELEAIDRMYLKRLRAAPADGGAVVGWPAGSSRPALCLGVLRKIGFAANRRLLDVQRIGHDCFIGEAAFQNMQRSVTIGDQRAAAACVADPRVQALLHVLRQV